MIKILTKFLSQKQLGISLGDLAEQIVIQSLHVVWINILNL